jgi:g-D-glutamyl-meso-diaminopimelate peptidase
VQKGDTLYRIARRYGISLTALKSANPQLQNENLIMPGQVIYIPVRPASVYVIQPGDTFYEISRKFNIRLADLLAANPGVNPQQLQIGQQIFLPVSRGNEIVDTQTDYGYAEMMEDIEELRQAYPFIHMEMIGYSVLGKSIPSLRIGSGAKQIHYNGSFHANEWITTPLLMKFVEDYARAYTGNVGLRGRNVRELYGRTQLWIVPMVNPDGVELVQESVSADHPYYQQLLQWNNGSFDFSGWKANVRGVDLNDQFPAHWEEEKARRAAAGPGPRDYPGTAPLTEPEAQAMANFTRNHDFQMIIAFHTQGEEIYWNYRGLEPANALEIAERFARVSGYRPVEITGSDAGYRDWFIQEYRRPGYTVEAGRGRNPLPITDFPAIYDRVAEIMLEGLSAV